MAEWLRRQIRNLVGLFPRGFKSHCCRFTIKCNKLKLIWLDGRAATKRNFLQIGCGVNQNFLHIYTRYIGFFCQKNFDKNIYIWSTVLTKIFCMWKKTHFVFLHATFLSKKFKRLYIYMKRKKYIKMEPKSKNHFFTIGCSVNQNFLHWYVFFWFFMYIYINRLDGRAGLRRQT